MKGWCGATTTSGKSRRRRWRVHGRGVVVVVVAAAVVVVVVVVVVGSQPLRSFGGQILKVGGTARGVGVKITLRRGEDADNKSIQFRQRECGG